MRLALIRIDLTEEQRRLVGERTGQEPTEALVVGMVEGEEQLENELTGEHHERMAQELWETNQRFVGRMQGEGEDLSIYEEYMGHPLEPHVPNVVVFR